MRFRTKSSIDISEVAYTNTVDGTFYKVGLYNGQHLPVVPYRPGSPLTVTISNGTVWRFLFLSPATKLRQDNIFTPVCQSFCSQGQCVAGGVHGKGDVHGKRDVQGRGHVWQEGGMHGRGWGCAWWKACMVLGGHAWLEACMAGSMHGRCGRDEACMAGAGCAWGACMVLSGKLWQHAPPHQILPDTVNEQVVRILLECILVTFKKLK